MHVYPILEIIHIYFFQNGWSPLLVASEQGHLEVVKILLTHHARVDVFDEVRVIHIIVFSSTSKCHADMIGSVADHL